MPAKSAMSCPQCIQGYVLPGEPKGTMVDDAYFSPAPEGAPSSKAIVFLTDIFGLRLKNCKIIADELAKRVGCDVWVPDLFAGASRCIAFLLASSSPLNAVGGVGGYVFDVGDLEPIMPDRAGQPMSWGVRLQFLYIYIKRIVRFYRVRASVVDPRTTEVRPLS